MATHHFRIRGEIYYHPPLRTESLQVGILPDAPIPAALAQLPEALRSERRGWGWNSLTRHHFAHVVQRRDGAPKTRTVPVQTRPWAPSACSPMKRRSAQDGKGCRCKSCHADQFGMSTGQACRACLLNSACLRASGASPRHSAILRHEETQAARKESHFAPSVFFCGPMIS